MMPMPGDDMWMPGDGGMSMPGDGNMWMPGDGKPMTMMHMTFFWGKNVEVLFSGWPGYDRLGMYVLALFVVFALAVSVELLSAVRSRWSNRAVAAGVAQTGLHALRMGLSYMVMLAVMSFNIGVLLAAVLGHAFGFFVFGTRLFRRSTATSGNDGPDAALPPIK